MEIEALTSIAYKRQYNDFLKKENEGAKFFDTSLFRNLNVAAQDKLISEYKNVLKLLDRLLTKILYYKREEILDGFNVEKEEEKIRQVEIKKAYANPAQGNLFA